MILRPACPLASITDWFNAFSGWATGRTPQNPGGYHNLFYCMNSDYFWITLTVFLDLAVAAGYLAIAYHWYRNQRQMRLRSPAYNALGQMRNIFLFCGLCGYVFIPVKLVWPAWRLYDIFLAVLVFYTWKYAWSAGSLRVIYAELDRSAQLSRDLEQSRAESQRKSVFLNAISHDLRTPLNGIVLQAHMAEVAVRSNDPDTMQKALCEIKASAQITASVLNSLLQYARMDDDCVQISTFDYHELLERIRRSFTALAEAKGLELRVHARGPSLLRTDVIKLERILMNLVDNAIKFTSRGGIDIQARLMQNTLTIEVHDTGEGLSAEHQTHLFEEFFQVHNTERDHTKGLGLGLAIARRLAEQLQGQVRAQSELGRGSTFTLTLPDVAAVLPPPAATIAAPASLTH